jgi:ribosomal protein S18 acetylase RimI-like enzyme
MHRSGGLFPGFSPRPDLCLQKEGVMSELSAGISVPLPTDLLLAARALVVECGRLDGTELPLDPTTAGDKMVVIGYSVGGALVGLAGVVAFDPPEASLVVHPHHRRAGIGRALLAAARNTAQSMGAASLILVSDGSAPAGRAFALAVGARPTIMEHTLQLDPARIAPSRPPVAGLTIRPATQADAESLARVQAAAFGEEIEEVREFVAHSFTLTDRQYLLAERDGEPVGVLRIGRYGTKQADVTAFGVLPSHQGHGIGRQMLSDTVTTLLAEGWPIITIDVETENVGALGLYLSCGFVRQRTYEFYEVDV